MSKIKLLNYVLSAVIVQEDSEGNIVGKATLDAKETFTKNEVGNFLDELDQAIIRMNETGSTIVPTPIPTSESEE